MAIQNFVSGGFYGKLGQMVGQRWKNKRTLRTYVIPKDPKTPAQMAERSRFGGSVPFAQYARLSNGTCTFFENPNFTEWNYRMRRASELYMSETEFLRRLPLIPSGMTAPFIPTSCVVEIDPTTKEATFTFEGTLPERKRAISIYVTNNPLTENPNDVLLLYAESENATPTVFHSTPIGDFEFSDSTQIRVVSNDDRNSEIDMILSAPIVVSVQQKEVRQFDTSILTCETKGEYSCIVFNQDWGGVKQSVNVLSASVLKLGGFVTADFSNCELVNNNGKTELRMYQRDYEQYKMYLWGEGSQLVLSSIKVETNDVIYKAENVTLSPQDTTTNVYPIQWNNGKVYPNGSQTILENELPSGAVFQSQTFDTKSASICGLNANKFTNTVTLKSQEETTVKTKVAFTADEAPYNTIAGTIRPYINDNATAGGYIEAGWKGLNCRFLIAQHDFDTSHGKWVSNISPNWQNTEDEYLIHLESNIPAATWYRTEQVAIQFSTNQNGVQRPNVYDKNTTMAWGYSSGHLRIRVSQPTGKIPSRIGCYVGFPECHYEDDFDDVTIRSTRVAYWNNYNQAKIKADDLLSIAKLENYFTLNATQFKTNGEAYLNFNVGTWYSDRDNPLTTEIIGDQRLLASVSGSNDDWEIESTRNYQNSDLPRAKFSFGVARFSVNGATGQDEITITDSGGINGVYIDVVMAENDDGEMFTIEGGVRDLKMIVINNGNPTRCVLHKEISTPSELTNNMSFDYWDAE